VGEEAASTAILEKTSDDIEARLGFSPTIGLFNGSFREKMDLIRFPLSWVVGSKLLVNFLLTVCLFVRLLEMSI
jgi:hypothetical protein